MSKAKITISLIISVIFVLVSCDPLVQRLEIPRIRGVANVEAVLGQTIGPITFTNTGGAIARCSADNLPEGPSLERSTEGDCVLSGRILVAATVGGQATVVTITAANTSGTDTARLNLRIVPGFAGSNEADEFTGTDADELILGGGGADTLNGGGGNDRLEGGAGNDALNGGAGDTDTAQFSTMGAYTLGSMGMNITVTSTALGTDTLSGIEIIRLSAQNDTVQGNPGRAISADGGEGSDTFILTEAADFYAVGGQPFGTVNLLNFETIDAGSQGIVQSDILNLGTGTQSFVRGSGRFGDINYSGFEIITGGEGEDTLFLSAGTTPDSLTLAERITDGSGVIYTGFETIDAGEGDDTLNLGVGGQTFEALAMGATMFTHLSITYGIFEINGGSVTYRNFETIDGGAHNDTLDLGTNYQTFTVPTGTSSFSLGGIHYSGFETVTATTGSNLILTNSDTINRFSAGELHRGTGIIYSGFETINGSNGDNIIRGSYIDETIIGGPRDDEINGGGGEDTLDGGGAVIFDGLTGFTGADTFVANTIGAYSTRLRDLSLEDWLDFGTHFPNCPVSIGLNEFDHVIIETSDGTNTASFYSSNITDPGGELARTSLSDPRVTLAEVEAALRPRIRTATTASGICAYR